MKPLHFCVESVAFWAPALPGWPIARAAFRGEGGPADPPAKQPAPTILAPAERRRAPDSVALALEVAAAAVHDSGRNAATLPSIFISAHGDLAVNDYMCSTLADQPTMISPTRFHNSVHNAAAMVLAPALSTNSAGEPDFQASLVAGPSAAAPLHSSAARALACNAMADALPFFEALACVTRQPLDLPLTRTLTLRLTP